MNSFDDGEWFEDSAAIIETPIVPDWIDSIMIGDCGFELGSETYAGQLTDSFTRVSFGYRNI